MTHLVVIPHDFFHVLLLDGEPEGAHRHLKLAVVYRPAVICVEEVEGLLKLEILFGRQLFALGFLARRCAQGTQENAAKARRISRVGRWFEFSCRRKAHFNTSCVPSAVKLAARDGGGRRGCGARETTAVQFATEKRTARDPAFVHVAPHAGGGPPRSCPSAQHAWRVSALRCENVRSTMLYSIPPKSLDCSRYDRRRLTRVVLALGRLVAKRRRSPCPDHARASLRVRLWPALR